MQMMVSTLSKINENISQVDKQDSMLGGLTKKTRCSGDVHERKTYPTKMNYEIICTL